MKLITSSSIRSSWRRLYATRHPPLAGDLSDEVRKIISTHHYSDILTAEVLNELSNNHECFELVSKIRGAISLQKGPSSNKASVIDPFDKILKEWLSNEVESDAVSTKRIDFKSSNSSLINKIIEGDAVHGSNATSIKELSSRENRRCFGLFHQSLSNDPIAFIHVALTNDIAFSMRYVATLYPLEYILLYLSKHLLCSSLDISADAKTPSCAIFYSVNSPHPGLSKYPFLSLLV